MHFTRSALQRDIISGCWVAEGGGRLDDLKVCKTEKSYKTETPCMDLSAGPFHIDFSFQCKQKLE